MSYLYLPGRAGNYVSSGPGATTIIAGDLTLVAKLNLPRWVSTASADGALVGRWGVSYLFTFQPSGVLRLYWRDSGAVLKNQVSTAVVPNAGAAPLWVAATLDVDNGAAGHDVKFWTSGDGVTWSQLGTTITTAGTTSVSTTGSAVVTVGADSAGTGSMLGGPTAAVYRAQIYSGSGFSAAGPTGTLAFDANFEKQAPGTVSFVEDSVNAATVTVTSSATAPQAVITGRRATGGLYLPRRTGNYATSPTAAATSFTDDIDLAWCMTLPNAAAMQVPCAQMGGTGSWYTSSGTYFRWYDSGGTLREAGVGTNWAKVYDVPVWARWTLDVDTGAGTHLATLYRSTDPPWVSWPTNWTTLWSGAAFVGTTTRRAPSIGTSTIGMGGYGAAMPEMVGGIMHRFVMKNGIGGTTVFDADFTKQPRGTVSFAEDANGATVTVASSVNDPKAMILGRAG